MGDVSPIRDPNGDGTPLNDGDGGSVEKPDRDLSRQVLAVAQASIQRERARADTFYTKARNAFAIATTLFGASQAVFVTSIGREGPNGQALLSSNEISTLLGFSVAGAILVALSLALLLFDADRGRPVEVIEGDTIDEILKHKDVQDQPAIAMNVLALKSVDELNNWAETNGDRVLAYYCLAAICLLAGGVSVAETMILISYLN